MKPNQNQESKTCPGDSTDEDHGTVYYWDPETGQTCNGAVGDFILGWTVTGVK